MPRLKRGMTTKLRCRRNRPPRKIRPHRFRNLDRLSRRPVDQHVDRACGRNAAALEKDGLLKRRRSIKHLLKSGLGVNAEEEVEGGQPQIAVDQEDSQNGTREHRSHVGDETALTHSAFTAGNGNDLRALLR